MKHVSISCSILVLLLFDTTVFGQTGDSIYYRVNVAEKEYWWLGIINQGHIMPIEDGYQADLNNNLYGNQAQPLLLSSKGNVIWSEEPFIIKRTGREILLKKTSGKFTTAAAGKTLKEAYLYASKSFFPPSGKAPHPFLFSRPQYNTWIELLYNQNQQDVLKYAKGIIDNGFPPGVIMIDDNWQEDYGTWKFHPGRFPDPAAMVDTLHQWGFSVMLWVCPFISPDSETFRKLQEKDLLMKDDEGYPKMVKWWNGSSAVLDLTDPNAAKWFNDELKGLMTSHHIDGFKFDAGDPEFYVGAHGDKSVSANEHAELFNKIGVDYPFNEYRASWKMGGQPLAQRLRDKGHSWGDLQLLIPDILLQGIMGYPFTCPDMIGGGEMGSFLNTSKINQDLIVRSAQCHALMPMMQFSVAPWRVLDQEHLDAVKKSVELRSQYIARIEQLTKHAATTGEPIVRMMEYEFPNEGYEKINDQFLLGTDILVAPILSDNATRTVIVPKGKWKNMLSGKIVKGPTKIQITTKLHELPYFIKQP
jgi:alpha-glucosidase (family GH31 glycosyl hydrolase)